MPAQPITRRLAAAAFLGWWLPVAYLTLCIHAAGKRYPWRLTSWIRPAGAQLAGGAGEKSKHVLGWAVDLVPLDSAHWQPLAAALRAWPGIWVLDHTGTARHLHVQVGRYPIK